MSAPALNLAIFRITVFTVMFCTRDAWLLPRLCILPREMLRPPHGLEWVQPFISHDVRIAWVLLVCFLVSCLCAALGAFTRLSTTVAALLGVYVLGVPQMFGTVFHVHHLVWFSWLLAASPCGDAWSVDAWWRRKMPAGPSPAYGFPLRIAWLLVGFIFFFPGMWKWVESGMDWAFSDNLRRHMMHKWFQEQDVPSIRIDQYPLLIKLGALSVMVFEVAFIFLLWRPSSRRAAVAIALFFHAATDMFMHIRFTTLWPCYVMFADWQRLVPARMRPRDDGRILPVGNAQKVVAAVLVAGSTWCGLRGNMQSWPFACYPTFQWMADAEARVLVVEVVRADGHVTRVPTTVLAATLGTQRLQGLEWSLMTSENREIRLRAVWPVIAPCVDNRRDVARVRFSRGFISVEPDHWNDPPRIAEVLLEMDVVDGK